jgi:hypothetical protein
MKMGYDQHWSFGVQQQVAKSFLVDLAYVGNRGVHLNAREDFNVPEAGPGAVQSRRPYPRFSGFAYISSSASSSYHAVQGKLEKRLSGGIWFLNSYTISKSLWRQQTSTAGGRYAFENGSADFHVPHSLSNSFGYKLPFGRGGLVGGNVHPFVNGLIGGWQLQGILIFRSGLCFTPTVSRDVANTGVSNQRPNRLAFGRSDHPTLDRWFDVSAFAVAPNYTYGNSGLRILAPDIVRVVDFSLFKQFRIAEKANLQFRFEAFNLPNTASFAAPASTIDTAAAGRVTATTTSPRQMQFALKLSY